MSLPIFMLAHEVAVSPYPFELQWFEWLIMPVFIVVGLAFFGLVAAIAGIIFTFPFALLGVGIMVAAENCAGRLGHWAFWCLTAIALGLIAEWMIPLPEILSFAIDRFEIIGAALTGALVGYASWRRIALFTTVHEHHPTSALSAP